MHFSNAFFLIFLTELGTFKCSNEEHREKALSSIKVTDEGMITSFNEVQEQKSASLIEVIEEGITIFFNDLQSEKNSSLSTEGEIVISSSELQFLKALTPIKVTDEGIVIFFNDMQSLKKRDRIFVSAGGSSTFVSLQQSMKTWSSISATVGGIVYLLQFPKAAAPSNSKLGGSLATFNWEHA